MKKSIQTILATTICLSLLSGCGSKISAECERMYEYSSKMTTKMQKLSAKDQKKMRADFEKKWADLDKAERKEMTQNCSEANKMYDSLKELID